MSSPAAAPDADRVAIHVEKGNGGDEEDPEDDADNDAERLIKDLHGCGGYPQRVTMRQKSRKA